MHGVAHDCKAILNRLKRVEGQVRGIAKMVEDDRYCVDILTQIAAVETALEAVGLRVLEAHVNHCVADALTSGDADEARAKTAELLDAVTRFSRSR